MPKTTSRSTWRLLPTIFLLSLFVGKALEAATGPPCDRNLGVDENDSYRYQPRGERCEGLYQSDYTGSLELLALLQGSLSFPWRENVVLRIKAASQPPALQIQVRAVGIPLGTHYRMDALLDTQSELRWPIADVIYPKKIHAYQIGAFGFFNSARGDKIFVPLRVEPVDQDVSSSSNARNVILKVRSTVTIVKLHWRWAPVVDGSCNTPSRWQIALDRELSPGDPLSLHLPSTLSGEICLNLSAEEKDSDDPSALDLRMFL